MKRAFIYLYVYACKLWVWLLEAPHHLAIRNSHKQQWSVGFGHEVYVTSVTIGDAFLSSARLLQPHSNTLATCIEGQQHPKNKEIQRQRRKSSLGFAANYPINLKSGRTNSPDANSTSEHMPFFVFFVFFCFIWFVCLNLNKTVRIELFAICFFLLVMWRKRWWF